MEYLYLISSVLAGSFIGLGLKKKSDGSSVKVLLTFSGAYLLSIGVFHLLPELYETHSHSVGLYIMGGFFLQLILEFFSKGIEHGHSHTELFKNKGLPISVLISLFVHALLESLPIGAHHNELSRNALLWGIVIHKLPVSVILFAMLSELTKNVWKIVGWMLLFAMIAPLGVYLGTALPFLGLYSKEITAVVMGIFLHISTTILFESAQSHRFNFMKLLVTLGAIVIAWFSVAHH